MTKPTSSRQRRSGMEFTRISLRFDDPLTETGFISSCKARLVATSFAGCLIAIGMIGFSLGHNQLLRGSEFSSSEGSSLRKIIVGVWLSLIAILSAVAVLFGCRRIHRFLPPLAIEVLMTLVLNLLLMSTLFTSRWYLAQMHGYDPPEVYGLEVAQFSDTALLLVIDAIITASHLLIPVRWFILCSSEVVALAVSGYALFSLDSREESPSFAFACLAVLVLIASVGKRSQEYSDRNLFRQLVLERGLRYAAEHELSWRGREVEDVIEDDLRSQKTTGTMATNESDAVFAGFHRQLEAANEVLMQMETLVAMGLREHWLVNQADVLLWPDRIIGAGGFGYVVVAELHGTQVAMKLHRRRSHSKDASIQNFQNSLANELRVLRRLRHPHIVAFYGACIDAVSGDIALLFEWVRGAKHLDKYITRWDVAGATPTSHRCKVLEDLLSAVRYLHAQVPSVVHGDLKPANILVEEVWASEDVDQEPRAKLLDFGLSRVLSRHARPLGGTLGWKAPETVKDRGAPPKPSADVYVFGLLVHFAITGIMSVGRELAEPEQLDESGRHPRGPSSSAPHSHFCHLEWPDQVPLASEAMLLCARCLDVDPAGRPLIATLHAEVLRWDAQDNLSSGCPSEGPSSEGRGRPRCLEPRGQVEPMEWRQGVQALMSMICKTFEDNISATFDFYDEEKTITSATKGWIDFCGEQKGVQRSMLYWFPAESSLWPWMGEQINRLLSGAGGSFEAEEQEGCTLFFQQVRGRRSEDPAFLTYSAKVAITFPDPHKAAARAKAAGTVGLQKYDVTLHLVEVTTQIRPSAQPARLGSRSSAQGSSRTGSAPSPQLPQLVGNERGASKEKPPPAGVEGEGGLPSEPLGAVEARQVSKARRASEARQASKKLTADASLTGLVAL
eukprot:CAMPEP_0178377010 /NCGR_PEP_ID=MMETSP0689_2-20121128/3699_1 /TAXON_ID=160604 /ORGANISM="Amphidinium massartii, Strain CS-259" /LENGTH=898 /DNA_ID=CAMNT_0019997053 /DNA_START=21 /DNA_END=2714 /DNA_ORIENTATION=-